ncbi:GTPase HflX [Phycicoccus endophyticus]|uniref:GTPase HflX n=1 Tax=Phycicoccus endophyticus TaxID=1690220 RepID=A0A7G9R3T7_9MICO|nr:GTPase HflX [Phycicoccus endophyticus]NHI18090.1 GTPase HflX [Phycicoccus endophyticus]QNN50262.1 GTPase HflX [Phycicoccus endophyticus]GGL26530.1 GTPase HflX [Phycicoccus endophyticus]
MTARDILTGRAAALASTGSERADDAAVVLDDQWAGHDGDQYDREERAALRRVSGLSTELEDVTEVEYRRLRLERVVLAAVWSHGTLTDAENSLRELAALAETAGSQVLAGVVQRRPHPDPSTYLGKGKAAELRDLVIAEGADTVVADTELAPSQRRALEDVVKVKVIDRTALILDIFAQHAKSREGKAQVELAQLQYLLPRLRGWGESMSRQAGGQAAGGQGMGSRGPGETKIELDRRRINSRIARLRREIAAMKTVRETKRGGRRAHRVPSVAIAGYTNAGKSSLLNRLTGAGVLVEDQLFATLDPTVRRAETPDGRLYTLSDTVGFVRQLPHELVEAFRSTLEEVADADLLLHVVDGSHPDPEGQISAVRSVLAEVGADDVKEVVVVNKVDLADPEVLDRLRRHETHSIAVSARTGAGVDALRALVAQELPQPDVDVEVLVPYDRGDLVSRVHETGEVLASEHLAEGTRLSARVDAELAHDLAAYAR